jgi:hypothetical protein
MSQSTQYRFRVTQSDDVEVTSEGDILELQPPFSFRPATYCVVSTERVGRHGLQRSFSFSAADASVSSPSLSDREGIGNACDNPVHASPADTVRDQLGGWRILGISHASLPCGFLGFFQARWCTLCESVAREPLGSLP